MTALKGETPSHFDIVYRLLKCKDINCNLMEKVKMFL